MPISFGAGGKSTPKRKSSLPSTLPTNGLLVYLDAANPNSYPGAGSTWFDLSGNNLHATLYNGAAQNKNVAGGVMQFSSGNTGTPSTADYILTQTPDLSTSNYTVIFASRYTILSGDGNSGRGRIVSGYNNNWLAGQHSGSQARYYANNWVNNPLTTDDDAKWRIYAATGDYTNDQWTMLINNSQVVSNNGGTNGPNGLILGKGGVGSAGYPGPYQEPSKGQIAFLLVYNRVLTTQELTDVYNLFKNRFIVADSNLKLHIDAADSASYSGSGTAVSDISGNGLNCTLTNGPTFSNGAFNLDNVDDVILTNSTVDLRSDFTLEGWFSLNADTTASFFGHGAVGNVTNQSLHTHFISNHPRGHLFAMYFNDVSSTTVGIVRPKNTWYHVVFTYSHSSPYTKKMYLNGVDLNLSPEQTQAAYAAAPTVLRMGQSYSATGGGNCKIAQTRYYNRVLTAAEILQNYNATKGIFYPSEFPASISNLEVWLKSDSGVYDSSSNLITIDNTSAPAWEDKSGNNRSALNTNATYQPKLRTGANAINNLPALSFDGVDDKLVGTWSGYNTSKPYTIFQVVNYTTFGDGLIYGYSLNDAVTQGDGVRFLNSSGRKLRIFSNGYTDTADLSGVLPASGTLLLTFQHSGVSGAVGTFTVKANGQQIYQNTSVTRASAVNGSSFTVGAFATTGSSTDAAPLSPFNGKVSEHLYFSKILNDKEINIVEAYLNAKWGVYSPVDIVKTNLIFYLDAKKSNSYPGTGTTWFDMSGKGNNVTLTNGPTYNAAGYFTFDGINDHLGTLSLANTTGQLTFEVVMDYNNTGSYHNIFEVSPYNRPMLWIDTNGKLEASFQTASGGVTSANAYNGQKITVTAVYDSINSPGVKLYVNGSLIGSNSGAHVSWSNPSTFTLFNRATGNQTFSGKVYSVKIYDRALSDGEIQHNYKISVV